MNYPTEADKKMSPLMEHKRSADTLTGVTIPLGAAINGASWPNSNAAQIDSQNQTNNKVAQNTMTTGTVIAAQTAATYFEKAAKEIVIRIREVENGRVMSIGNKVYIIGPDESLVDTIRVALVNAKLE